MSESNDTLLALSALDRAATSRPPAPNAVAESLFSTLTHEYLRGRTRTTLLDAHRLVGD